MSLILTGHKRRDPHIERPLVAAGRGFIEARPPWDQPQWPLLPPSLLKSNRAYSSWFSFCVAFGPCCVIWKCGVLVGRRPGRHLETSGGIFTLSVPFCRTIGPWIGDGQSQMPGTLSQPSRPPLRPLPVSSHFLFSAVML